MVSSVAIMTDGLYDPVVPDDPEDPDEMLSLFLFRKSFNSVLAAGAVLCECDHRFHLMLADH